MLLTECGRAEGADWAAHEEFCRYSQGEAAHDMTLFYGSSYANNGKGALNTPEATYITPYLGSESREFLN
eukprot:4050093-Pyramimonas_sp.AAC.2